MQYSQLHELNEYLIQRFNDRIDYIKKIKPHMAEIDYKNFSIIKSQIIQFMCDVEDDLRQSSQSLKTMKAHEKEILDELSFCNSELKKLTNSSNNKAMKNSSEDRLALEELNEKYSQLMKENLNIKKKELEKDSIVIDLNDKKLLLEKQLKLKDETIKRLEATIEGKKQKNSDTFSQTKSPLKPSQSYNYLNSENNPLIESKDILTEVTGGNESGNLLSLNSINNRQSSISNTLKTIMSEREKQKGKINLTINDHLREKNQQQELPPSNAVSRLTTTRNEKVDIMNKISELVKKINYDINLYDHLYKVFGREFIHKLVTTEIKNDYIERISKCVENYEENKLKTGKSNNYSKTISKDFSTPVDTPLENNRNNKKSTSLSSLRKSYNDGTLRTNEMNTNGKY